MINKFSHQDTAVLKAISIILIVLHNALHPIYRPIKVCNEFDFSISRATKSLVNTIFPDLQDVLIDKEPFKLEPQPGVPIQKNHPPSSVRGDYSPTAAYSSSSRFPAPFAQNYAPRCGLKERCSAPFPWSRSDRGPP